MRFAVESDRKERNAAQKSRFYLFHPEWDPETDEGRRRREGHNRRYRDRNDRGNNRRDGRGRYEDRFRDEEPETFDVNLYDDDAGALAKRVTPRPGDRDRDSRSASVHSGSDRHRPSTNRDKELFPNRKELFPNRRPRDSMRSDRGTYSRDRSRSPGRNDRDAMDDDLARDREAVRNNREKARSLKERISRVDAGDSRDSKAKELFPTKVAGDGRRAQMDQVPSDLLAGMSISYDGAVDFEIAPVPFSATVETAMPSFDQVDRRQAGQCRKIANDSNNLVTHTFADRITDTKGTMSIRGSAHQSGGSGMLKIKGTSVKELFPNKFNGDSSNNSNNAGKELFADKISGGGRRRQKAEDLFY